MPEILRNVFRRKLRTGLTVFGITIGIFALVVLGAMAEKVNFLVSGAEEFLSQRIALTEEGSHPFVSTELIPQALADRVRGLDEVACTERDINMLLDPDEAFSFGMPRMISGADVREIEHCEKVVPGRLFSNVAFAGGDWWEPGEQRMTVLGVDIADDLDARVGGTVTIRDRDFVVSGILQRSLTGPDNMAFVSLADARVFLEDQRSIYREVDLSDKVSNVYVIPKVGVDAEALAERIQDENPDLDILSPNELVAPLETNSAIFNFMIIGVAMVALVVGGLSVINTMIMSVAERVREIGIKKAVGATDFDILREYLLEAAFIGFIGGAIGLGLGALAVRFLNDLAQDATGTPIFVLTTRLLLGSLVFATALGTVAGFFPSMRASRLKPVEALKAE
ncbi:MAG: ABC transporter permease [Chloroflexi bacterium]|nr:ABC transporter permease [Chloroflexota bacterium]